MKVLSFERTIEFSDQDRCLTLHSPFVAHVQYRQAARQDSRAVLVGRMVAPTGDEGLE